MSKTQPESGVHSAGSRAQQPRLTQVDGLRAIAALSVVGFHYTTRYDQIFHHIEPTYFEVAFGYLGVNLFFAISGFVIYMTLDGISAPLDFVVSRFSRLYPAYWVAVASTWIVVSLVGLPGYGVRWNEALVNLSMLQSFFSVQDVDRAYWSLQVELLFYVWMLGLWVTRLLRHSLKIFILWVGMVAAATLAETFGGIKISYALRHFLLLDWIPWFALGIAAYLSLRDRVFKSKHGLLVLIAIFAIAASNRIVLTMASVVVFALVWIASREEFKLLEWKPLVFFGVISYPLYLLHEQIGWVIIACIEARHVTPWLAIIAAFVCVTLLATLLNRLVERPVLSRFRSGYSHSSYAVAARNFSQARWAAATFVSIGVMAVCFIVSSRL
ncbi:MAG: acyltransferase [Betaproteobacteria bacterium]